jgi:muramoyltetrapeptide carboxypeptidase
MIRPPFLTAGDSVGLVATGRKAKPQDLEKAIGILSTWGLRVQLSPHLYNDTHSYLAGADRERLEGLQMMLDDPAIKAIFCARGGYGTTRILDLLDFSTFCKHPKWVVGFSDVTALHLKLNTLGIESIHGTMPLLFSKAEAAPSVESLRKLIFGEPQVIRAAPQSENKTGNGMGRLIGGNLSLLTDSLGTSSEINTSNKILILEEIDEYAYRVDRMLTQLQRAGKLNHLAGLIIGHMTDIKDGENFMDTVEKIVLDKLQDQSYPVAFRLPVGHENPNLSWIEGATARLYVSSKEVTLEHLLAHQV